MRWASLHFAPGFKHKLSLEDTLFELCRLILQQFRICPLCLGHHHLAPGALEAFPTPAASYNALLVGNERHQRVLASGHFRTHAALHKSHGPRTEVNKVVQHVQPKMSRTFWPGGSLSPALHFLSLSCPDLQVDSVDQPMISNVPWLSAMATSHLAELLGMTARCLTQVCGLPRLDRQTDRQRQRQRQRQGQGQGQGQGQRQRQGQRQTDRQTDTDRDRDRQTDSLRQTDTPTHLLRTVIANSVVECILRAKTLPLQEKVGERT